MRGKQDSGGDAQSMTPTPHSKPAGGGTKACCSKGSLIIATADIGPNDVLCGRGVPIQRNPGNVAFRAHVAARKAEYVETTEPQVKQRIAKEILDHVRYQVDPPGRFLKTVNKTAPDAMGLTEVGDCWRLVDESTALEKVKMTLRQKIRTVPAEIQRQKPAAKPLEEPASEEAQVPVEGESLVESNGPMLATNFSENAAELPVGETQTLLQTAGNGKSAEEISQCDRAKLLQMVRIGVGLAKNAQRGHGSSMVVGCSPKSDTDTNALVSLGSALYLHFAGVPFGDDGDSTSSPAEARASLVDSSIAESSSIKMARRQNHGAYAFLRDLSLPVSICVMVSGLLHAKDGSAFNCYETTEEVEEDLRLMLSDPDRYLFDPGAYSFRGQLELPEGKLYARDWHVNNLMGVFDRVIGSGGACEAVLISGYSGTGKSALAESVREPLSKKKGHFISGKFDELGQVQPMSVIFAAFNNYCNHLLQADEESLARIRMAINNALGSQSSVLMRLIPNLTKVIGEPSSEVPHVEGKEALNRFIFYFRAFVRAIASHSHPVVLFLDDLQWADKASLEIVTALLSSTDTTSLLFVGCYRDNELSPDHPLIAQCGNLAIAGVGICRIELENIDQESVNALVSDTLHLSPTVTRSLGRVVHAKTSGNPLIVVQFLRSLFDEHLLQYSASLGRWEWDMEAIQSKNIADNVVGLMRTKMLRLDPNVQWLLKVAACLGSRSEATTLKLLASNDDDDGSLIIPLLDTAVSEGLMCKGGSFYKFSHDQIQQAAYALIPASEHIAYHLHIGKLLWKAATEEELDGIIFIVLDQLHRGSDLISDHDEKVQVARLCLRGGEKAMRSSAFLQATTCLLQGSALLEEFDWENHYDLSLQLFTSCAEAQYVTGNYDGVMITLNPVLTHGRRMQDTLPANSTMLVTLNAQGRLIDAINHGFFILAQLGEPFPSEPCKDDVTRSFAKTRAMLHATTIDEILENNNVPDAITVAIMEVISILASFVFQSNQKLLSMLVFRLVQLTLCRGVSEHSAFAFSSFGVILCGSFGEYCESYHYGKLALSLLERFKSQKYHARVYVGMYSMVAPFTEPLQACLNSIKLGFDGGMSSGDIGYALVAANMFCQWSLQCGSKLGPLAEEVGSMLQQSKEHDHIIVTGMCLPSFQAILNLMRHSEDPSVLTGDLMNQDELLTHAHEKQQLNIVNLIYFLRMWLAYLFGKYDVAAEMANLRRKMCKLRPFRLESIVNETFYGGLIAVVMARRDSSSEWRTIAYDSRDQMKAWAENSAWNFEHKLDLLEAEIAYLNGDLDGAAKAYNDAIRSAGEHRFVHEQALACERAGMFHSDAFNQKVAKEYFEQAHNHYVEWGAKHKAEDLLNHMGTCEA